MKKLLTILLLLIIPFVGFSQKKFKLNKTDKKAIGYGMIIGGVSLTLGVAFTPPEYTAGPGSTLTPIYKQPAQLAAYITGPALSIGGLFTVLANKGKRNKKYKRR